MRQALLLLFVRVLCVYLFLLCVAVVIFIVFAVPSYVSCAACPNRICKMGTVPRVSFFFKEKFVTCSLQVQRRILHLRVCVSPACYTRTTLVVVSFSLPFCYRFRPAGCGAEGFFQASTRCSRRKLFCLNKLPCCFQFTTKHEQFIAKGAPTCLWTRTCESL